MKVQSVHTNKAFNKQFQGLSLTIQKKALKSERLFRENPFHPSLRLHKLKDKLKHLWSISLDRKCRIVFEALDEGVILFVSIGLHSIYED